MWRRISKEAVGNLALPYQGEANGSPLGRCSTPYHLSYPRVCSVRNQTDARLAKAAGSRFPHRKFQMSGTSRVVLLIEPDEKSSTVYADALRGSGFTVVVVPDTAEAADALMEIAPQIIIARFDPRTHDECFALCERLKADARTTAIPLLLTSAGMSANDLERATHISVLGVSIGPRDGGKITSAVRGVLAAAEGLASISQPERNVSRSA